MTDFTYNNIISDICKEKTIHKVICISGKFNILHPGHIRLFKFAKDLGGYLVVALEPDSADDTLLPGELRLEALHASNYIDYAFVLPADVLEFIQKLKPDIVVKGNEFENNNNPEKELLESYGGKLVFGSGDIRFSSLDLLRREFSHLETSNIIKPLDFLKRHQLKLNNLAETLNKFSSLNVLVIGDTIVDEYITCDPLGMSQEDPTIAVSPISSNKFLGGAGIVAAHAKGLGAKVSFYSVIGNDEQSEFVKEKINEYDIHAHLYQDPSRPTTLKQRYRAKGKTLLRVNHLKQHHINNDLQNDIYQHFKNNLKETNLIIFSDFSYGCLPQALIDKIINLATKRGIMIVADSQSSSQTGDISRFKNISLVTPTEKEARLAVGDFESGLIVVTKKLFEKSNPKNIILTMAAEGILINTLYNRPNGLITDQLPAMNFSPKDVAGGGDSFLTCASMALASGANIWESAFLGSIAAAVQVGRVGNIPLTSNEIMKEINT